MNWIKRLWIKIKILRLTYQDLDRLSYIVTVDTFKHGGKIRKLRHKLNKLIEANNEMD